VRPAPCGAPLPDDAPAVVAPAPASPPIDCPMCGLAFTTGMAVCRGCPLHAGCDLVRCPRCEYTFPRRSRLVDFVRRVFHRRAAAAAPDPHEGSR
jgi:hypothetical protein